MVSASKPLHSTSIAYLSFAPPFSRCICHMPIAQMLPSWLAFIDFSPAHAEAAQYLFVVLFLGSVYPRMSLHGQSAVVDRLAVLFMWVTALLVTAPSRALICWDMERRLLRCVKAQLVQSQTVHHGPLVVLLLKQIRYLRPTLLHQVVSCAPPAVSIMLCVHCS